MYVKLLFAVSVCLHFLSSIEQGFMKLPRALGLVKVVDTFLRHSQFVIFEALKFFPAELWIKISPSPATWLKKFGEIFFANAVKVTTMCSMQQIFINESRWQNWQIFNLRTCIATVIIIIKSVNLAGSSTVMMSCCIAVFHNHKMT